MNQIGNDYFAENWTSKYQIVKAGIRKDLIGEDQIRKTRQFISLDINKW